MKPDYAQRMNVPRSGNAFRFRATEEERTELEEIVTVEGGTLTQLLVEGVWRVIEDRNSDPDYQALKQRVLDLQAQLAEARGQITSRGPAE